MSRRPFSIAELAARSRPTGYDPSKSLKDLLRIATAQRNNGDAARDAGDVEAAFIHYAKASTLMLEELPTHPKYGELTHTQKDAVLVHGQVILDSLGGVKGLVSERFTDWRTKHPDADLSAPVPTPTPQRQRERQDAQRRTLEDQRRRQEDDRRRHHEEDQRARRAREAQRLVAEQERRQRAERLRKDGTPYDQVANIAVRSRQQQEEKERIEREELLAEKKRQQEAAAFLGYPTPASLHTRVRPESYEGQNQPVSVVAANPPPPPPTAPPVSIPQAHHFTSAGMDRSASAAGLQRTGSAARIHNPHPPTSGPQPGQDRPIRAPSRTGSRVDHHPHHQHSISRDHRPISDPRNRENPPVTGPRENPARPGSRADHRPTLGAIRTDAFGVRNESAPAAYGAGTSGATAAAYNAAYGPGLAYGQNPATRPRKMSVVSPVKDRPPGGGFNGPPTTGPGSHPPTTQAPVPRRRTSSSHGVQPRPFANDPRLNGVFPDNRQPFQAQSQSFPQPQNPSFPQAQTQAFQAQSQSFPQPDTKSAFPQPQPDTRPELQGILPLESPSHTWAREPEELSHVHAPAPRRNGHANGPPIRGSSYPPPVTTTSPPPGPISYPNLMTNHQREQGYLPSTHSMFSFAGFATALAAERDAQSFGTPTKTSLSTPPSLLFQPNPDPTPPNGKVQLPGGYGQSPGSGTTGYVQAPAANGYVQPANGYAYNSAPAYPAVPRPNSGPTPTPTNYATRPPPAVPTKDIIPPLGPPPTTHTSHDSPQTHDEPDDGRLRQVLLPEEAIQKFMSIAKPNTLQNRETCGLLLGKKRSSGFAVTTLLIPRQRATSDTCEMVEEELILDFQETRGLITLGWIHTHPTQSCFMSSLDLHTHSGYQASLKEAFAIVCAPSQSPNVGIFRLTDPPGLQMILKCTAKEAFHPHTAGNIYTDADQGHVKMMKKLDLSIVDLRRHST